MLVNESGSRRFDPGLHAVLIVGFGGFFWMQVVNFLGWGSRCREINSIHPGCVASDRSYANGCQSRLTS